MHIEWFSDAVEEVGYEGFEGCTFGRLLELLVRRHPDLSNRVTEPSYQTRLITYLCNHSQVTVTRVRHKQTHTHTPWYDLFGFPILELVTKCYASHYFDCYGCLGLISHCDGDRDMSRCCDSLISFRSGRRECESW